MPEMSPHVMQPSEDPEPSRRKEPLRWTFWTAARLLKAFYLNEAPYGIRLFARLPPSYWAHGEAWMHQHGHYCELVVQMRVKDRGTQELVKIEVATPITELMVAAPDEFYETVRRHLQTAMLHELDESMYVRGKLRWDPHAPTAAPSSLGR